MRRGRPKGQATLNGKKSHGPLGDLIRTHRIERKLGLVDVAKACRCSVQFISNIEHGRAPLPWDKAERLANVLGVSINELRAANLAVRSDFKSFVGGAETGRGASVRRGMVVHSLKGAASIAAAAANDSKLHEIFTRYQAASPMARKRFQKAALGLLTH